MAIINVTAAQGIDTLLSESLHMEAAWRRHLTFPPCENNHVL